MAFNHEGEAFLEHHNTEKVLSFGLESKRLNKSSAKFATDLLGAGGKVEFLNKNTGNGVSVGADYSTIHLEGGYAADNTTFIPKYTVSAAANGVRLTAEGKVSKDGIEHKVISGEVGLLNADLNAGIGGNTVMPYMTGSANTGEASGNIGIDSFGAKISNGKGSSVDANFSYDHIIPNDLFDWNISAGYEKASWGETSVSFPGIGSVSKSETGELQTKLSLGKDSFQKIKDDVDSLSGKKGTEKGTAGEEYVGDLHRKNLLSDAEDMHARNTLKLSGIGGIIGKKSERKNAIIADTSRGYVDKLDRAMDRAKSEKLKIDSKLSTDELGKGEKQKLSATSEKLGSEIEQLSKVRDQLAADCNTAGQRLNKDAEKAEVGRKSTNRLVADAKKNSQQFEDSYNKNGYGNNLAKPSTQLIESNNQLNGRMNELDRRILENDSDISQINKKRGDYLEKNNLSLKDAVAARDKTIMSLNKTEEKTRAKNDSLREEKGKCEKALLEVNKNYAPRPESAGYESKGRELAAQKIDIANAQKKAENEIANYCNQNGIEKDENGEYSNRQDPKLQELLENKENLQKEEAAIKNDIGLNKRDLAESEKDGKTSLTVAEKDGNADVKWSNDGYAGHIRDNEDLRYKDASKEAESAKESDRTEKTAQGEHADQHETKGNSAKDVSNGPVDAKKDDGQERSKAEHSKEDIPDRSQSASRGMPTTAVDASNEKENASHGPSADMPTTNIESGKKEEDKKADNGMPATAEGYNSGKSGNQEHKSNNNGMGL